jgi:arylsulfatase A-like enzyme
MMHAVDLYPDARRAGRSLHAKCKPLDGVNVWDTIAKGKPSPRTESRLQRRAVPRRVRQGDWKLIWRTMLPTSVDLYNLADDPYEKNNLAAAHPDKVHGIRGW